MTENLVRYNLHKSTTNLKFYLLEYCEILLEEQRKLNIQISLTLACNKFRGTNTVTKQVLIDFAKKINSLDFVETENVKKFKHDLQKSIDIYSEYYDENGYKRA
jgi:hypothetical protein